MDLAAGITSLPGIGPVMGRKLSKLGIATVFDLLYHVPFRYEDRSHTSTVALLQPGETVTVSGTLTSLKNEHTHHGKLIQKGLLTDASGSIAVVWFNQTFLTRTLIPGTRLALYGKVEFFNRQPTLVSPEYEIVKNFPHPNLGGGIKEGSIFGDLIHMGRIVPIYPETAGVTSKYLRAKIFSLLSRTDLPEIIPPPVGLDSWISAMHSVHFPKDLNDVPRAMHRLAYDELFLLQLKSLLRRKKWQSVSLTNPFVINKDLIRNFIDSLPFTLTPSQTSAISDILGDLSLSRPMNRLLEGDVGSGKTVVAATAAYAAYLNGFTTLILAPTQILAAQHYQTLSTLFKPFGIEVGIITGNLKLKIKNLKLDVIVGTHALLNLDLPLDRVGLVVIDEQHRFGVAQRSAVAGKGTSPHLLTLTATPIPRTIALTLLGDLDLSLLAAPPAGRRPIKTWVVPESKRASAYTWISSQLTTHSSQAFIVCPFIEPSESAVTVKAATAEFTRLQSVFPEFNLGLLHGRLSAAQKDAVIARFRAGDYHILVSTPVVEVGIDIPNAGLMVIEDADRFGLVQLHQLRGRVGRNSDQAYCLLFSSNPTDRLKAMETHSSGLELAEIDLRLRGPGEIFGVAQHGLPQFKIASYSDLELIDRAKTAAEAVLPHLASRPALHTLVRTDKMDDIQPN